MEANISELWVAVERFHTSGWVNWIWLSELDLAEWTGSGWVNWICNPDSGLLMGSKHATYRIILRSKLLLMHCINVVPVWFFSTLSYVTLIEPLKITQTYLNYISNSFRNNSFLRIPGNAVRYSVGTRSLQWMYYMFWLTASSRAGNKLFSILLTLTDCVK